MIPFFFFACLNRVPTKSPKKIASRKWSSIVPVDFMVWNSNFRGFAISLCHWREILHPGFTCECVEEFLATLADSELGWMSVADTDLQKKKGGRVVKSCVANRIRFAANEILRDKKCFALKQGTRMIFEIQRRVKIFCGHGQCKLRRSFTSWKIQYVCPSRFYQFCCYHLFKDCFNRRFQYKNIIIRIIIDSDLKKNNFAFKQVLKT